MQRHDEVVTYKQGAFLTPAGGATISVINADTLAAASLFSDNGVTAMANPTTADSLGRYFFYAADGRYTVTVSGSGFSQYSYEVLLDDPATYTDEQLATDLASTASTSLGDALVGGKRTLSNAVAFTLHSYHEGRVIRAKLDFGAVGDNSTDDTTALNNAITAAKTNGLRLLIEPGTYKTGQLVFSYASAAYEVVGSGVGVTTFVRKDDTVDTLLTGTLSNSYPYKLSDFSVDCNHATYPNGNHALSFADINGLRLERISVSNYKNAGILLFGNTANTYYNNIIRDCHADGGNIGIMIADMNRSHIIDCEATNVTGSPGYGLELKNDCRYCSIINGYASGCVVGLAFGNDSGTSGVKFSKVRDVVVINPTAAGTGFSAAYAENNNVAGLIVDMNSGSLNAIDLQSSSFGNSISAVVKNLATPKGAVRFRTGCTDNSVVLEMLDNINSTGYAAIFDSGCNDNAVLLRRMRNPVLPSNGVRALTSDSSTGQDNLFIYEGYPTNYYSAIASGVITIKNPSTKNVQIDTESAAASDNLDTITGPTIAGMTIIMQSVSNVRDVTVKHGTGNISLAGSADFTLDNYLDKLTLMYDSVSSKWVEVSRSDNGV